MLPGYILNTEIIIGNMNICGIKKSFYSEVHETCLFLVIDKKSAFNKIIY